MERMTVNLKKQLYQIAAQCMVTIEGRGGLEYRDNIPENMQESERYEKADEACDNLSSAVDSLEEAISSIEAAIE